MRSIAFAAVLALSILLALHLAGPRTTQREALDGGATWSAVPPTSAEGEVELTEAQPVAAARPQEARRRELRDAVLDVPAATVEARLSRGVHGEVLLIEEGGVERAGLEGRGACALWRGKTKTSDSFAIEGGRFRLELSEPAQFQLTSVVLDGRDAIPETMGERHEVGDEPLMLRVVRPARIELHVLDAITAQHLDQVELRTCLSMPSGGLSVPDDHWIPRATGDGQSPLFLEAAYSEASRSICRFLVHSPGYAWTPVSLDMRWGGNCEVRLERGGELEVELTGVLPRRANHLSLYRADESDPNANRPIADHPVHLERRHEFLDLPAGLYRVRFEFGDGYSDRVRLGEVLVDVVAGARQRVVLQIETLAAIERARMSGRVRVPAAWGIDDYQVFAKFDGVPLEDDRRHSYLTRDKLWAVEGAEDTFAFDFGELQTGDYEVRVWAGRGTPLFDLGVSVQLGPEGRSDLFLEVSPPCRVLIRLSDAITGEALDCDLACRAGGMPSTRGPGSLRLLSVENGVEFLAPQGELFFASGGEEHQPVVETVTLVPGLNSFAYQVERACSVRLLLRDGETTLPWSPDWKCRVERVDGGANYHAGSVDGDARTFRLGRPGRYRLSGLELEGFAAPESVEFEAVAGETVERVIALKRE